MPTVNAVVKRLDGGVEKVLNGATSRSGSLLLIVACTATIGLGLLSEQPTDWRFVILLANMAIGGLVRFATWPRELPRIHTSLLMVTLLGVLVVNLLRIPGSSHLYWVWNALAVVGLVVGAWRLVYPVTARKPTA